MILVGTKFDLKDTAKKASNNDYNRCLTVAKDIGATSYVECSAKTAFGLEKVFEEAVKATAISKAT